MAYVEDTIWCHPKFTDLSSDAFTAWVKGVAYSSGMSTKGHLSPAQIRIIGGTTKVRRELIRARLWDENGDGILIHDWDDYNSKRDERKAADRERKRRQRQRLSA